MADLTSHEKNKFATLTVATGATLGYFLTFYSTSVATANIAHHLVGAQNGMPEVNKNMPNMVPNTRLYA